MSIQSGRSTRFPGFWQTSSRNWGQQAEIPDDLGVAGVWNDMNEPASFNGPSRTTIFTDENRTTNHARCIKVYATKAQRLTRLAQTHRHKAFCHYARLLCRQSEIHNRLDRRQSQHLDAPAHGRATALQPRTQRHVLRRHRRRRLRLRRHA